MIKNITYAALLSLLLVGCGTGVSSDNEREGANDPYNENIVVKKYNLWEYMTPNKANTNTFTLSSNSMSTTYTTNYKVTKSRVEEVADYAKDEKTIYIRGKNKITVKFEKGGRANGTYDLALTADVGDTVTKRNSTCKFTRYLETFSISNKNFKDVIEITCGDVPGYYEKGTGEIAQIENKNDKSIRVLSN